MVKIANVLWVLPPIILLIVAFFMIYIPIKNKPKEIVVDGITSQGRLTDLGSTSVGIGVIIGLVGLGWAGRLIYVMCCYEPPK